MKKIILPILAVIIIIILAVAAARVFTKEDSWKGNPSTPKPTGTCKEEVKTATLPNPASQNCLDKGGKLAIIRETAGEIGICKFNDGTECEEWQFFRGECQKGQYQIADTSHPYSGFIDKSGIKYTFKSDNDVVYDLQLPPNASQELKSRLISELGNKDSVTIVAAETPPLSKILLLKSFQEK